MNCSNPTHVGVFPSDCNQCHDLVKAVVKSKNIPSDDYQIYLKNGGFIN